MTWEKEKNILVIFWLGLVCMLKNCDLRLTNVAFFNRPQSQFTDFPAGKEHNTFISQTWCLPHRFQDGCEWSYSNTSTNTHNDIVLEHILEKDKCSSYIQCSNGCLDMHIPQNYTHWDINMFVWAEMNCYQVKENCWFWNFKWIFDLQGTYSAWCTKRSIYSQPRKKNTLRPLKQLVC